MSMLLPAKGKVLHKSASESDTNSGYLTRNIKVQPDYEWIPKTTKSFLTVIDRTGKTLKNCNQKLLL